MNEFQVAYMPIGVPTFHLESAKAKFEESIELISSLTQEAVFPDKMLLSIDALTEYLDTINPGLIILQNVTFANAAYASEVLKRFSCPVLLWTLREPVIDGGRLRLNSLTGAFSAGNALMAFRGGNFEYVFGDTKEKSVTDKIQAVISAAKLKKKMSGIKMASIGHTPQGFGFGRALDIDLLSAFGVTLESVEARELIDIAKSYTEEECESYIKEANGKMTGLQDIPDENVKGFARIYKAYKEYVENNHIAALSSRCWPDFFTAYGTPVCAVLAMLNDMGVAASCEADAYGALSMYMGMQLTGKPVFFGDPVSLDENENTITFWHCGTAACQLANECEGPKVGLHPNRKIGPVMDFGCKPCKHVSIFRVGIRPDGKFRFFLSKGEALDKEKQFCGTSVVVKTENDSKKIISDSVKDGWEPHFVVIYGDVNEELTILGHILGIEVCSY